MASDSEGRDIAFAMAMTLHGALGGPDGVTPLAYYRESAVILFVMKYNRYTILWIIPYATHLATPLSRQNFIVTGHSVVSTHSTYVAGMDIYILQMLFTLHNLSKYVGNIYTGIVITFK